VPCELVPLPLKFTVAVPNGATLPSGLAWSVPLTALVTAPGPLKPASVIAVVVFPTVMFPEPARENVPELESFAVYLKVKVTAPEAPLNAPVPPVMEPGKVRFVTLPTTCGAPVMLKLSIRFRAMTNVPWVSPDI
jgi:hypothetical protein